MLPIAQKKEGGERSELPCTRRAERAAYDVMMVIMAPMTAPGTERTQLIVGQRRV